MNFDYKENGGKKKFCYKSKALIHVSQYGEHGCSANNNKNGDYNKYPGLSLLPDDL